MAFERDWTEVRDQAEALFIYMIRGLQEREKFKHLIPLAKKMWSSAGDFDLGLDDQGKLTKITFSEAKQLLKDDGELHVDDQGDLG